MTIRVVRKLAFMQDLVHLEKCLRTIYHTADGATCQTLMTMEYQCWRNNVIRQLLLMSEEKSNEAHTPHLDVNRKEMELLSQIPGIVQAFLSGYKIVYAKNMSDIAAPAYYVRREASQETLSYETNRFETRRMHQCIEEE
jgi:hypothetical protein